MIKCESYTRARVTMHFTARHESRHVWTYDWWWLLGQTPSQCSVAPHAKCSLDVSEHMVRYDKPEIRVFDTIIMNIQKQTCLQVILVATHTYTHAPTHTHLHRQRTCPCTHARIMRHNAPSYSWGLYTQLQRIKHITVGTSNLGFTLIQQFRRYNSGDVNHCTQTQISLPLNTTNPTIFLTWIGVRGESGRFRCK